MVMHLAEPIPLDLSAPAEAAAEASVGYGYHVALNGRSYLVDLKSGEFRYRTVELLRPQQDAGDQPGDQSINPEVAWRRSVTSWHLGAGQVSADRDPAGRALSDARFRSSKGIDIWTDDQISLLQDTDQKRTSANSVLKMVAVSSGLYFIDGTTLGYVAAPSAGTWTVTTVTGTSGTLIDLATDGNNVYATSGANVYKDVVAAGAASAFSTEDIDVLDYCKGRLMGAEDNELFYCTDFALGTFTSLFIHGNTAFRWVGFAEGHAAIYAAGNGGNKGLIYRIPIKPDGSALDVPIVAGETLPGETITGIGGGLGFIVIGTSKGIRFCESDNQGNLTLGAPFGPANAKTFTFWDRYCYFGWTNYDAGSTGLGRFTPLRFSDVDARIPAYASDLMVTSQGAITSVVVYAESPYFAIAAVGFYGEDTANLVTSGTIDAGDRYFGVIDQKMVLSLDVAYANFVGTVTGYLSSDGGTFVELGSTTSAGTDIDRFHVNEQRGERHEVRLTLIRATATTGPTVTRWGMRAHVVPENFGYTHYVPLILRGRLAGEGGTEYFMDAQHELEEIVNLYRTHELCLFQRGAVSHSVILNDFEWRQDKLNDAAAFEGTCLVVLKEV